MLNIPIKVNERISKNIKKFQKILITAKNNDINEADTVSIIKDMLNEIFGYDKYTEITSEYAVKKTFCDLAIKKDGTPYMLMEIKAIGIDLKDCHTKQALDYGANAGIDWIVLSNGISWKIYKVMFSKPIETELIYEFDFTELNTRKSSDLEMVYYISKEALPKTTQKGLLDDFREQKQLLSKYMVGQLLLTDDVINALRRSIKKIAPSSKITIEEIKTVLESEVIKRDILESDQCADAKKRIMKANRVATSKKEKILAADASEV